jgi:hypothetical protein
MLNKRIQTDVPVLLRRNCSGSLREVFSVVVVIGDRADGVLGVYSSETHPNDIQVESLQVFTSGRGNLPSVALEKVVFRGGELDVCDEFGAIFRMYYRETHPEYIQATV